MQVGTLVAGKYRVERVIGRGGMGLVCEASHIHLGTRVALKFLAEEMAAEQTAVARFNREARASAQLKGDHICRVSDYGIEGKLPYIVMELLQGTDLARLSKVRVLDVPTAALYVRQACMGLAEAHAAGIIHRDLKPGNLFLTRRPDGSPLIKVLDFGVAKAPIGDGDANLTGTSNVVGSPGFMSPEQFRSSKTVDGRADVWSLGVILYKLVSGRLPFKADGFAEFALAITRDSMPPLSEAPPEFEAVVARCLEKEAAKRYPDVMQLAEALQPFAAKARPSAQQMDVPVGEPSDISGVGGDGPDTAHSTLALAGVVPGPKPAIAKVPALVKVPAPAGVASIAPVAVTAGPPSDATRTVLGVATGVDKPNPTAARSAMKPTAATSVPLVETIAGTAVGAPGRPYGQSGELPAGTQVGEYRIDEKIGEGGMGVVYSATHPMIGKRAAIKVIAANLGTDPVVVQRFVQEARSVNQIGHPNIVDVFAFGNLPDGRNYFVMEYLQGESLRSRLRRAFMSIPDAIQILDEIAGALEAAHENGIVHRDLKPDNVFLAALRRGFINVKLLDFGIAKLAVNDGGIAKTSTGEMIGTPLYLSPEQARGKNVDHRTDIYALGVMMYEMITGRLPFIAESAMDIVMMHITTAPRKPSEYKPDIPVLLEQTILEMLAKEPDQRPTLTHLRNVFAELVASGQVQLESSSTATFRSDLKHRPASSPRNQANQAATSPLTPPSRPRTPSDAPTAIAFNPGSATLTPSDQGKTRVADAVRPPKKSRVGLAILLVLLAGVASAVTVLAVVKNDGAKEPVASNAVTPPPAVVVDAVVAPGVADGVADAGVAVAVVDAGAADVVDAGAVAAQRSVVISVNVRTAKVEVDGVAVDAPGGVATLSLPDGTHRVVASAAGRLPVDKLVEVSEAATSFDIKLEPKPRSAGTTATATDKRAGAGSGAAKPSNGQGSGSSTYAKDAPIDPF